MFGYARCNVEEIDMYIWYERFTYLLYNSSTQAPSP